MPLGQAMQRELGPVLDRPLSENPASVQPDDDDWHRETVQPSLRDPNSPVVHQLGGSVEAEIS